MRRTNLLAVLFVCLVACSSNGSGAPPQGQGGSNATGTGGRDGGVGGLGGGAGSGLGGATVDAGGGAVDAAAPGTPFGCGDVSCAIDETYCRQIQGIGGQNGGDAGLNVVTSYDCASFKPGCAPRDCSCIVTNPGNVYCASCSQASSGGILAICGAL
jgi:hypothetical protein